MQVLDSRRLTGPGLLLDQPGAVLDISLGEAERTAAIAAWERAARRLVQAVGWSGESLVARSFPGGVSLAFTAPVDGLYAATELNEEAWEAASAELESRPAPDFEATAARLREVIANERNPRLVALRDAARERKVTFLADEDLVSVGSGSGVMVWPAGSLPDPAAVEWSRVYDVPAVLVTGSNGKTTVVRLISAMLSAAGRLPGSSSTEGVQVGESGIAAGDFSGPGGARLVLRQRRVETAVLETARGGILRRGIAPERATVAVVTNIAEDHLGEFGVVSLEELAQAKLLVAKALASDGYLVLNADDPTLVTAGSRVSRPLIWFTLDETSPLVRRHIDDGGSAVVPRAGGIVLIVKGKGAEVIRMSDAPITFGGSARHNVANAMAAVAAAAGLGLEVEAMTDALRRFGSATGDNPGRANLLEVGGARVLVDYAHNAHGMSALVGMAQTIPARRRLVMLGQAGDRQDHAIREFARAAFELQPDRIILKDADQYLRGRAPGEVPRLMADELLRLGTPASSVSCVLSETAGVREALAWARPGDLLVLAVHQDRQQVLGLFTQLENAGWRAGDPLPG